MLAEDGSHSTDQPSERVQAEQSPQGEYLEQKSHYKAEYSNTQQGLPVHGILSQVARL
jgi:hypothetical protein